MRRPRDPEIAYEADFRALLGQIESNYDEVTDSFDSMNLKAELLRGMSIYQEKVRTRY